MLIILTNMHPKFKTTLNRIPVLFCLLLSAFSAFSQNDWILKNEKDGVKVFYRQTSDVHEVKLATSIKTTLSGLIKLFNEVENYPKWGYKIIESRLLHKVSDTEMYYYSKIDFPWPLDDRDLIMHTKLEQDPETKRIVATSKAAPYYIPENKGVVRITDAHTRWTIIPGAGGWTYIEYFIHSSPGGNIPDWMVNAAIDVGPRETIKGIRDILRQPEYQTARYAHIKE